TRPLAGARFRRASRRRARRLARSRHRGGAHLGRLTGRTGNRRPAPRAGRGRRCARRTDPFPGRRRRDQAERRARTISGTIVCGVNEAPGGRSAAELARALGVRLGLRLVLVHVVDDLPAGTHDSLGGRQRRSGAERTLAELASEIGNGTEKRIVLGSRADALAQVAAEEGADLIVLGSQPTGLGKRKLRCTLAREHEATTPVLVAPPSTRKRSNHRLSVAAETGAR